MPRERRHVWFSGRVQGVGFRYTCQTLARGFDVAGLVRNLADGRVELVVEAGAGSPAGYPDAEYLAKGAKIVPERRDVFAQADILVQVLCYGSNDKTGQADVPLFHNGQVLIGFLRPLGALEPLEEIAGKGVTSFAVELMPRTTRAQSMDALSSMGTICGYKAVLISADTLPRIFPMLTTAAGTITPGRVLVIGAGVAGLQAIATAAAVIGGGDAPPRPEATNPCGNAGQAASDPSRDAVCIWRQRYRGQVSGPLAAAFAIAARSSGQRPHSRPSHTVERLCQSNGF